MTFLDRQGHWPEWESTQQNALAAARRRGDIIGQAQSHRQLGRLRIQRGPYAEAEAHLARALELFRAAGDPVGQARVRLDIAQALERQRRHRDAITHSLEALTGSGRPATGSGSPGRSTGSAGATRAGRAGQALPYCEQALALDRELGNLQAVSATLHSLGYVHHLLGDHAQAVTCYQEALGLSRQLGDRYGQADALAFLGDAYRARGELTAARQAWRQALVILDELRHPEAAEVRGKLRETSTDVDTGAEAGRPPRHLASGPVTSHSHDASLSFIVRLSSIIRS